MNPRSSPSINSRSAINGREDRQPGESSSVEPPMVAKVKQEAASRRWSNHQRAIGRRKASRPVDVGKKTSVRSKKTEAARSPGGLRPSIRNRVPPGSATGRIGR